MEAGEVTWIMRIRVIVIKRITLVTAPAVQGNQQRVQAR
jgi:hypothetical protein